MKLLKMEFALCIHPTCFIMPALSVLVLVPGYPYGVSCFYVALSIYFVCLTARENHDAAYTLTLPVSRAEAVQARITMCALLELAQLALLGIFTLAKYAAGWMENPAGLDAGLALIGEGFVLYTIFNMIFFPMYYKDINKPGPGFLWAGAAMFLWIVLEIVGTYAVPFVQMLDTKDPVNMGEKALFTAGACALFLAGTVRAGITSVKKFEEVDLSL